MNIIVGGAQIGQVYGISNHKYKKKIAIYLGNWFDFPHIYGMSRFIDILDWIKESIKYAKKK